MSSIFSRYHLMLGAFAMLIACAKTSETDVNDLSKTLIVEGFVFVGLPIEHIRLAQIQDNGSYATIPITDATVTIMQGEYAIDLELTNSAKGIYSQIDTTQILNGFENVKLIVKSKGQQFEAEAAVPAKIQNLQSNVQDVYMMGYSSDETVAILTWDSVPTFKGYCLFISPIGEESLLDNTTSSTPASPFTLVNEQPSIALKSSHLLAYPPGIYSLYITAINEEYYTVYGDNGFLNPGTSPTNITGGWGIFTVFNGAFVEITIH